MGGISIPGFGFVPFPYVIVAVMIAGALLVRVLRRRAPGDVPRRDLSGGAGVPDTTLPTWQGTTDGTEWTVVSRRRTTASHRGGDLQPFTRVLLPPLPALRGTTIIGVRPEAGAPSAQIAMPEGLLGQLAQKALLAAQRLAFTTAFGADTVAETDLERLAPLPPVPGATILALAADAQEGSGILERFVRALAGGAPAGTPFLYVSPTRTVIVWTSATTDETAAREAAAVGVRMLGVLRGPPV